MTNSAPAAGSRPPFDAYSLPLPKRREGPAAALSFLAHLTIVVLVLWRGAELFASGGGGGAGPPGGGGGGGRPAVSWFALPAPASAQAREVPLAPPPPAVTVPTVALPPPPPVKIELPQPELVAAASAAAVGTGAGTTGGPGQGPGTGGGQGKGTGTGIGSDSGPGSGGAPGDIFHASPRWTIWTPPGAPREVKGKRHEVRFWVTAEGRVTRVEVIPPIKDGGYRREFIDRMMGYLFNPATTRDGRHVDDVTSVWVIP